MIDIAELYDILQENPEAFEQKRAELIQQHLNAMPEDVREELQEYQKFIDQQRKELSREEFLEFLGEQIKISI